MQARTIPVPIGRPSFLDAHRCEDLDALDADVAIIGVHVIGTHRIHGFTHDPIPRGGARRDG